MIERSRAVFDLYARLLADNRFFYYNRWGYYREGETMLIVLLSRPTTLDVMLAAHLLLLLHPSFPDPLLPPLLSGSYPTLLAHSRRVLTAAFPASSLPSEQLRILSRPKMALEDVLPFRSMWSESKVKKEKSEVEKRFDRMRWAWMVPRCARERTGTPELCARQVGFGLAQTSGGDDLTSKI